MKEVRQIPYEQSIGWIKLRHYAHRIPSISFSYGLYIDKVLVGIITFGKPASDSLCRGVCGEENSEIVIELNRLILNDELPKNSTSYLVGRSLKLLPKPKIVVSYADTGQGHIGYIYQATNFIYTGLTVARTDIDSGEGKHSRHYDKTTDYSKRKVRHQKHRYIYFAGCNNLISKLNYKVEKYPKGKTSRYNSGKNLETQGILL